MFSAKLFIFLAAAGLAPSGFAATKPSADDRVWISRADGSLQCDEKTGGNHDAVAEARALLAKKGVHVLEAKKGNDGQLRAQMCGIPTGNETRFLIPRKELAKAQALGFEAVR